VIPGPPKNLERERQALLNLRNLNSLREHPGWQYVASVMERGIENRKQRLLAPDCHFKEIQAIRLEIKWLQDLLSTTTVKPEDVEQWEKRVAFSEGRAKMLERIGIGPTAKE
jgi:hypothetical protein